MREILADHVPMSIAATARRMCVNRQSFTAMLAGRRPVTADMALRFRKPTGGEPGLYVHMQAQHALWRTERRLANILAQIEAVAIKLFDPSF